MASDPNKELARIILDSVGARTAVQLQRMPIFSVPGDSERTFSHLLDKLDHATRGIAGGKKDC
jgi:hypothetical protein